MIAHAVPFGSSTLVANCGQRIDGQHHTGHYSPVRPGSGIEVCAVCQCEACQRPTAACRCAEQRAAERGAEWWAES